ncbi:MAG: ABC transporter ATP-binding protein [Chloroflexota bacterium]
MAENSALSVAELSVRFQDHLALDRLTFSAEAGEFLLLAGPSGSGKSTLLRCLDGLIPHTYPAQLRGRVVVGGLDTARASVAQLAQKVGLVFQNPESQLFHLTVQEEVAFAPRCAGWSEARVQEHAAWALDSVGIGALAARALATLSTGEKQRVAIAAAIATRPSVLALDEPTAHLDVTGAAEVLATLLQLGENGVAIILGEHRTGAPGRLAGQLLVLDEGRLVANGPPAEVFARRELMRRLGIRRPVDEPAQRWENLIAGGTASGGLQPLAELRGVAAGYGPQRVLHDVDLAVYPGEILALVGDNGAGKTTVARLLAGLLKPSRGQVLVGGKPVHGVATGVGLVLQNPLAQLFCDTVQEEVDFGPRNLEQLDPALIEEALAANDLCQLRQRNPRTLSCGQQQRTVVASVQAMGPRLLVLDEPTMGQDWNHLARMADSLRRLTKQGHAILMITHDYKLAHRYADRAVLLRQGRVAAAGPLRQLSATAALAAPLTVGV